MQETSAHATNYKKNVCQHTFVWYICLEVMGLNVLFSVGGEMNNHDVTGEGDNNYPLMARSVKCSTSILLAYAQT